MKCQQQRRKFVLSVCVASNLIQSSNQSHHYLIIPLNLRTHICHINIYNAINLTLSPSLSLGVCLLCVHAVVVSSLEIIYLLFY